MAVTSREIPPATERRIGMLEGDRAEVGLIWMLRVSGVGLVLVSIVGSFYGLRGLACSPPWVIPVELWARPGWVGAALGVQAVLSLAQWGARHRAARDARWWGLFAAALLVSAGLNWVAFAPHLLAWGWPWVPVALAVIGGDALAEILVIS